MHQIKLDRPRRSQNKTPIPLTHSWALPWFCLQSCGFPLSSPFFPSTTDEFWCWCVPSITPVVCNKEMEMGCHSWPTLSHMFTLWPENKNSNVVSNPEMKRYDDSRRDMCLSPSPSVLPPHSTELFQPMASRGSTQFYFWVLYRGSF